MNTTMTTWTGVLTVNAGADGGPEDLRRVRLPAMPTPDGAIDQALRLMDRVDGAVDFVIERGSMAV